MSVKNQNLKIRVDDFTRLCLGAITVLLVLVAVGVWSQQGTGTLQPAHAGEVFTDAGAQRQAMVDEQKQTNAKLDELITLLKSGDVKVQVGEADGGGKPNANTDKK